MFPTLEIDSFHTLTQLMTFIDRQPKKETTPHATHMQLHSTGITC